MISNKGKTFLNRIDITLPYGQLQPTIEWCIRNCTGEWNVADTNIGYSFQFTDERDYVAFLIWKK